jgi:hypothetical protein
VAQERRGRGRDHGSASGSLAGERPASDPDADWLAAHADEYADADASDADVYADPAADGRHRRLSGHPGLR